MKNKVLNYTKDTYASLRKKKYFWAIPGAIVVIILIIFLSGGDGSKNNTNVVASRTDLAQTVLATGQVTSSVDLNLSFNKSGVVTYLPAKVGDKVSAGATLAHLDQGAELAGLTQARGALASAQARLKKTLEGASSEDITLAQVNLDQTKLSEQTLVTNAYYNLLNSTPEAVPEGALSDYNPPVISGTYSLTKEGTIKVNVYNGNTFSVSGVTTGSGNVTAVTSQPLGNSGLYITFPTGTNLNVSSWTISIPNKKASNYLLNYNAYQAALSHADLAINQKQAELDLKRAAARPSEVDLANADVVSAEGQVQAAQAKYNDTIIRAPIAGTVTKVDIKLGEQAQSLKEVISVQDVSNIYIEANINESNIAHVKVDELAVITLDAFGPNKKFGGSVIEVDPSATVSDGIVNYKIKISVLENDISIRPGMNANITLTAGTKTGVIAIPASAIVVRDGKSYVEVVTDPKKKATSEKEVVTGFEGDGNLVEITSGIEEGDTVIVIKK